ncbi:hypothetical protein STEG23_029482, partial [Scotinomys teguina]
RGSGAPDESGKSAPDESGKSAPDESGKSAPGENGYCPAQVPVLTSIGLLLFWSSCPDFHQLKVTLGCSVVGVYSQLSLEVPPPLMFPITVTPLRRGQDCSLKNQELDVLVLLVPGILDVGARPPRLDCTSSPLESVPYPLVELLHQVDRNMAPKTEESRPVEKISAGRVYNVTQHAVGIIVNKQVKGKILVKRINVWIEHIKHSKSRDSFLQQVKEND